MDVVALNKCYRNWLVLLIQLMWQYFASKIDQLSSVIGVTSSAFPDNNIP